MKKSLCIVTEEYSGLNKSGGIGAASRGLAELLNVLEYDVEVLITDLSIDSGALVEFVAQQSQKRIKFSLLGELIEKHNNVVAPHDFISKSYHVYECLKDKDLTAVHFNDWQGSGFYCAMARRQGLFSPVVITNLHGGSEWVRKYNEHNPSLENFELEAIEYSQIENSDLVISPSQYLLDWYSDQGIKLPKQKVISWILPQWLSFSEGAQTVPLKTAGAAANSLTELIFFGRHERRKGFDLFLDALQLLPPECQPDVTFIGRFDKIDNEFSGGRVFRKLTHYAGRFRFLNKLDQNEALGFIKRTPSALCVMPSIIENCPCVVGECFTIGVPFLASDVGGTSELVSDASKSYCLTNLSATSLADAIVRCVKEGIPPLESTRTIANVVEEWRQLHCELNFVKDVEPSPEATKAEALVSVCLTHFERPHLLRRALEALLAQTYSNFEIIIVDDGSASQAADVCLTQIESSQHRVPVRVIRSPNRYLGAARNLAASHANGEFLLFHDDDNLAEPILIETYVKAIEASACDILTSQYFVFNDSDESLAKKSINYFPIGIGGLFSFFTNRFGDANAIFRKDVFKSLGGFTELRGVGWEDWELFLRAFIRKKKLGVVPIPLFNYRVSDDGMLATGNMRKNFERLYSMLDQELPSFSSDIFRFMQRDMLAQGAADRTWHTLGIVPQGDLHQRMTAVDPNSEAAWEMLCELAFNLGRIPDAIDMGVNGTWEMREKYSALAVALYSRHQLSIRGRAHRNLDTSSGRAVKVVRGWAVGRDGRRKLPDVLRINGQKLSRFADVEEFRGDVAEHFHLPHDGNMLGFVMCLSDEHFDQSRISFRKFSRVAAPEDYTVSLVKDPLTLRSACIDAVLDYCEIEIEPPTEEWSGVLHIDTSDPSYAFAAAGGAEYISSGALLAKRHTFDLRGHSLSESIRIVVPQLSKVGVVME